MGRKESMEGEASAVIYPAMQAADVFLLDVDIMHAGIDQRKVHVLAREIAGKMKRKKAVAIHSHLLMGLQGPRKMGFEEREDVDIEISSKMSKSKPETCIFIHDSEEEINEKIARAYCPERQVEQNPIIELCEYILMRDGKPLRIERPAKFGGEIEFESIEELKRAYSEGKLHPADLKNAVSRELSSLLKPCREYFERNRGLLEF
jgi:tyrosyl-tRNA synthetase